jgi:hypothetical protein
MSSLMDPDGTNRIIKQQISEWHARVQEDRNAKLLEPEPGEQRRSLVGRGRDLRDAAAGLLSPLIDRLRRQPIELPQPAAASAREVLEGHLPT